MTWQRHHQKEKGRGKDQRPQPTKQTGMRFLNFFSTFILFGICKNSKTWLKEIQN